MKETGSWFYAPGTFVIQFFDLVNKNKLCAYCVLGTTPGPWNIVVNKIDMFSFLMESIS